MVRESREVYRIQDMAADERPRERLARLGAQSLSTAELLAILLRVGMEGENAVEVGQRLLQSMGGLMGIQRASLEDLCSQRGLGMAKASQIKAAIELGRRLTALDPDDRPSIHSPREAANLVQYEMQALSTENLRVIVLDTRNHLVCIENLYTGSVNSSMVRVGELFRPAIQRNGASIILIHNHPSGDPTPSPEDAALTRAAVQAGKLLDIEVLDHLVIGWAQFVSLKEKGLGFS